MKPITDIKPLQDYGFFGPESMTWRVWGYPTALTTGFQRSVVMEELDPALVAAVNFRQGIYQNPRLRYDRTIRYFATVAFGDSRTAVAAAQQLVKVHSLAVGTDPVTGEHFDANDPKSQLWIHLTGWHSVLKTYEMFGPGKLTPAQERQYWHECRVAAELQTCDPADVPLSRVGVHAYFDEMKPKLLASELASSTMKYLLDAGVIMPTNVSRLERSALMVAARTLSAATVASLPAYMREMAGIHQSPATDRAATMAMRAAMTTLARSKSRQVDVLKLISPSTVPIAAPMLRGVRPKSEVVVTPAEAFARYETPRPEELHQQLLAKSHA